MDLLKRIIEAIDQRYPQDRDAALYRQVMVLSEAGSFEQARKVFASLSKRFPKSRYVHSSQSLINWLERQAKDE